MRFPSFTVSGLAALLALTAYPLFGDTEKAPARSDTDRAAQPAASASAEFDALYEFGRQLFDDYAPDSIKEHYEFVSQEQWNAFVARLQQSLTAGSVEELAALEPDARRTLAALRLMPNYDEYADWLAERLDLIETAGIALRTPAAPRKAPTTTPPSATAPSTPSPENPPAEVAPAEPRPPIPYYDVWLERMRARPKPKRADELMPVLKMIFAAEGLPPELAWLAEVESSLNPSARSPVGARGLYQLMPLIARAYGLRTFPFDERLQPGKNARAAAKFLRRLHDRFDSWPLALAAYNAGEGRIAVAIKKTGSREFADIVELLPAETRMYVPKVLATLAVREKNLPDALTVPPTPVVSVSAIIAPPAAVSVP